MTTYLRSGATSDVGLVRSSNQDLALEATDLYAVADGMGGHAGGEVASRVAIDALRAAFAAQATEPGLTAAVAHANTAVWEQSQDDPDLRGMGTTLTALALVHEDAGDVLVLVNVGDSRTYRFHDGELAQVTTDHSLAEEMVRNGELTPAEAAVHPHRHILTRALGVYPEVPADLWRIEPQVGDRYLLCSDGLTNEVGASQIADVLATVTDPREATDTLVAAARAHGGSDNVTVVVVDVVPAPEGGAGPAGAPFVAEAGWDAAAAGPTGPPGGAPVHSGGDRAAGEPEGPSLSRRERRRERRRGEKLRRRRLITPRTLLFAVILAAIVVGAFVAVRWYDTNSYFVRLDRGELVIYQGRIGGFLWYHPTEVARTGKTTADVPSVDVPDLRTGVQESSVTAAHTYVDNLVSIERGNRRAASTTTTTSVPPVAVPPTAPLPTTAPGGTG